MSDRTWARRKSGAIGRVDRDLATRMPQRMGIHKALRHLFRLPAQGCVWVRKPNDTFGWRSALDVMLGDSVFDRVRVPGYLNAERGGW